ncbi:hypothetical protein [Salipaludibacillus aurantiacus]|nr:hypothetical protein [Salipaludibacillus aurantiacus]
MGATGVAVSSCDEQAREAAQEHQQTYQEEKWRKNEKEGAGRE